MARRLLLLNGFAVLGVAIHHASGYGFRAMFDWADRYLPVDVPSYDSVGSLPFHVNVAIQQVDAFTLPAFLFVSGFFVAFAAGGSGGNLGWGLVSARIKHLFPPFLVWTVLFFLLLARRLPENVDEVLDRYYYVVLLCQFYLLTPLIVPIAKKRWRLLLSVAAIVEFARYGIRYLDVLGVPGLQKAITFTPKWLIPTLVFYFIFGVIAGLHREALQAWLKRAKWALFATVFTLVPLMLFEYQLIADFTGKQWLGPYFGGLSRMFYPLPFILCFLAFDQVAPPLSGYISQLGARSLGIYLAHGPVMYVVAVLLYRKAPWVLGSQLLYQASLISLGLGLPLVLMFLINRSRIRGIYRYVFG